MDGPFDSPTLVELSGFDAEVRTFPQMTMATIRDAFDRGFRELAQLKPTGPGYACYDGDPAGTFDLQIGFPVDGGRMRSPSGQALAVTHLGGYEGLGDSWSKLVNAATAAGHAPAGRMVEVYVTDPSVTPEVDLRTDLYLLM